MISDTISDAMGEIFEYLAEGDPEAMEQIEQNSDWLLLPENLEELKTFEHIYDRRLDGKLITLLQQMREVRMILDTSPSETICNKTHADKHEKWFCVRPPRHQGDCSPFVIDDEAAYREAR